jgi:hypothetical protein
MTSLNFSGNFIWLLHKDEGVVTLIYEKFPISTPG